jgi:hypothetical protein
VRIALLATLALPARDRKREALPPPSVVAQPTAEEKLLASMTPEDDAKREALIADGHKSSCVGAIDYEHGTVIGPGFADLEFKMKEAVAWAVALGPRSARLRTTLNPRFEVTLVDPKTNHIRRHVQGDRAPAAPIALVRTGLL